MHLLKSNIDCLSFLASFWQEKRRLTEVWNWQRNDWLLSTCWQVRVSGHVKTGATWATTGWTSARRWEGTRWSVKVVWFLYVIAFCSKHGFGYFHESRKINPNWFKKLKQEIINQCLFYFYVMEIKDSIVLRLDWILISTGLTVNIVKLYLSLYSIFLFTLYL